MSIFIFTKLICQTVTDALINCVCVVVVGKKLGAPKLNHAARAP
jgi:hypothetical protein